MLLSHPLLSNTYRTGFEAKDIDRCTSKDFSQIGYNFVIDLDGMVERMGARFPLRCALANTKGFSVFV